MFVSLDEGAARTALTDRPFFGLENRRNGISLSAILGARSFLGQTRGILDRSCRVAVTGLQVLPPVAQARPFGGKQV